MNKIMLKVKPFQETLNSGYCGPASLKIVLSYYGIKKTEKELAKLCKVKKNLGADDKGIKNVAENWVLKLRLKTIAVLKISNRG